MRPARDRRVEDLADEVAILRQRQAFQGRVIQPDRFTRYDADLISRREMKAYVAAQITAIPGDTTIIVAGKWVCDVVTLSGTSGTLSETPADADETLCFVVPASGPDLPLGWVASSPGTNQFTISGTTISVGAARANATLKAYYKLAPQDQYIAEYLTASYPSYTATLAVAPSAPEKAIVLWQMPTGPALPLSYTSGTPGVNQFKIVSTTITLGRQMTANGQVLAHYPIS